MERENEFNPEEFIKNSDISDKNKRIILKNYKDLSKQEIRDLVKIAKEEEKKKDYKIKEREIGKNGKENPSFNKFDEIVKDIEKNPFYIFYNIQATTFVLIILGIAFLLLLFYKSLVAIGVFLYFTILIVLRKNFNLDENVFIFFMICVPILVFMFWAMNFMET